MGAKSWLLFASFVFYGWWNISYLPLILTSILVNFTIAKSIGQFAKLPSKQATRKTLLLAGLCFNVGLLCYFKYMDFFIANLNSLSGWHIPLLHIVLPLGISFFTLQQIAFLIDTYEGLAENKVFVDYALFVSFFPQLVAGPIVHHKEMMPQFATYRNKFINYDNIAAGLFLFSIGLFKKVVLADTFSRPVSAAFDKVELLTGLEAWIASLGYTFQLYFDFSGYSDMAVGLGLLFNIRLPFNFDAPYKSTSIIVFWRRWHITLSNFISTYLYTPFVRLYGVSFSRSLAAIITSMLIAGLWHGANWTYVLWGALHGVAIAVNHLWKRYGTKLHRFVAWFVTFNFINISLVLFRAKDFDSALKVLFGMFGGTEFYSGVLPSGFIASLFQLKNMAIFDGLNFSDFLMTIVFFAVGAVLVFGTTSSKKLLSSFECTKSKLFLTVVCFAISFIFMNSFVETEFLYFEF